VNAKDLAELERKADAGYVERGWSPAAWAQHLRGRATACVVLRPDVAAVYRRWAERIEGQGELPLENKPC
jgi:hypothetical protein